MAKKKKHVVTFQSITLDIDGTPVVLTAKDNGLYFTGWEQECEICGSHNGVYVSFSYNGEYYHEDLDII